MVQMMSKLTNGSEELNGTQYSKERSLLPGCQRSETPQTPNTLIGMLNKQKLQACHQKSNKNTSLIFEVSNYSGSQLYPYPSYLTANSETLYFKDISSVQSVKYIRIVIT